MFVIIAVKYKRKIQRMVKKIFVLLIIAGAALFFSCSNRVENKELTTNLVQNTILQQDDGTISLKVDKADCYHDMVNPSSNTAEWNIVVSKSGRFNVWLSSSTKDTTNLKYKNKVMLNILDKRLETRPGCDKIILNSTDVSLPYFKADSFMGELYIQDTGRFNVQLISEKIIPKGYNKNESAAADESKLLSVFLTPIAQ
jgi:hypothetical protein